MNRFKQDNDQNGEVLKNEFSKLTLSPPSKRIDELLTDDEPDSDVEIIPETKPRNSVFSEKLQLSDSDETNCTEDEDEFEKRSMSAAAAQQKASEDLFGQSNSDNLTNIIETISNKVSNLGIRSDLTEIVTTAKQRRSSTCIRKRDILIEPKCERKSASDYEESDEEDEIIVLSDSSSEDEGDFRPRPSSSGLDSASPTDRIEQYLKGIALIDTNVCTENSHHFENVTSPIRTDLVAHIETEPMTQLDSADIVENERNEIDCLKSFIMSSGHTEIDIGKPKKINVADTQSMRETIDHQTETNNHSLASTLTMSEEFNRATEIANAVTESMGISRNSMTTTKSISRSIPPQNDLLLADTVVMSEEIAYADTQSIRESTNSNLEQLPVASSLPQTLPDTMPLSEELTTPTEIANADTQSVLLDEIPTSEVAYSITKRQSNTKSYDTLAMIPSRNSLASVESSYRLRNDLLLADTVVMSEEIANALPKALSDTISMTEFHTRPTLVANADTISMRNSFTPSEEIFRSTKIANADTQSMRESITPSEEIDRPTKIATADTQSMRGSICSNFEPLQIVATDSFGSSNCNTQVISLPKYQSLADTVAMSGDIDTNESINPLALAETESFVGIEPRNTSSLKQMSLDFDKIPSNEIESYFETQKQRELLAATDTICNGESILDNIPVDAELQNQSLLVEESFTEKSASEPDGSLTVAETSSDNGAESPLKVVSSERLTPKVTKRTSDDFTESINISAKINIKIQFSQQFVESSESMDEETASNKSSNKSAISLNDDKSIELPEEEHESNSKSCDAAEIQDCASENVDKSMKQDNITVLPDEDREEHTPEKQNSDNSSPEQAEEAFTLQSKLLTQLYGDSWKTPDVIKTLRRTNTTGRKKRPPQMQKLQEDSMADFSVFRHEIPVDLESTRIGCNSPVGQSSSPMAPPQYSPLAQSPSSPIKPPQSVKRTTVSAESVQKVIADENIKKMKTRRGRLINTPKYRYNLGDSDTSSDEDNDDSYLNETELSHGDSGQEIELKPKRNTRKKGNRSKNDGDITYLNLSKEIVEVCSDDPESPPANHDENFQNHLKTLLDSCKFEGKPKLEATPAKPKRKLFTPRFGSEDENESPKASSKTPDDNSNSENETNKVSMRLPLPGKFDPINKQLEAVRTGRSIAKIKDKEERKRPRKPSTPKTPLYALQDRSNSSGMNCLAADVGSPSKTPSDKYGFLQSLDVCISKSVCHPDAVVYRDNYKTRKQDLANVLYKIYNEKCFKNDLDVPIVWNKKLLNTAGRCVNKKKMGQRESIVELSDKVLTSADRLRCTLIHELCHAATWIFQGDNGHGATWKAWALKANRTFPELPKIGVCHQYDIEYKYTYKCTLCGAKSHAHSKSKKVENIRCSYCHGSIEIYLNKKDKEGNMVPTPVKAAKGFAKFVKEKYQNYKKPHLKHADVMKLLSSAFADLDMDEKQKY